MIVQCFLGHMILPEPEDAPPRPPALPEAAAESAPERRRSYVVELDDSPVGLLVSAGLDYAFHAVNPAFAPLENARFLDAAAAELSARRLARRRRA